MNHFEILLISIGLAMDAFTISVCKGMELQGFSFKDSFKISSFFSTFQAVMPILGYFLGITFEKILSPINNVLAFLILSYIGLNLFKSNPTPSLGSLNYKTLFFLAIATSIDAFSVGITFSFFNVPVLSSVFIIGITTFLLSFIGTIIGFKIGSILQNKASKLGGITLIILGIKMLFSNKNPPV